MTRIVIDGVNDFSALLKALAAVQTAFADGRADFESLQEYFSPSPPDGGERVPARLRPTDGKALQLVPDLPRAVPLAPCAARGTHLRLVECWACWSDVNRGACEAVDVLDPGAWDVALLALSGADQDEDRPLPMTGDGADDDA